jgi:hypothetical protein
MTDEPTENDMARARNDTTTGEPTPPEPETPQFEPPYLGQIVYLERANPTGEYSGYYNGSYLILDETSGELFGTSLRKATAYDIGEPKPFPLVGAAAYRVLAVDAPTQGTLCDLDRIIAEAYDVLTGARKGQWIESVYERAYLRARQARHLIADRFGLPPNPDEPSFPAPAARPVRAVKLAGRTDAPAAVTDTADPEVSALLAPLADLFRPIMLAGAGAVLNVTFPPAT